MKVIWVHTFNPHVKNSGIFMHEFLKSFKSENDIDVELFYLGSLKNIPELFNNIYNLYTRRKEYDIIHCQYGSFCSLACMFLPVKKIVTLRGSDLFQLPVGTIKEKLHSKLAGFFTKVSLNSFNKIIVMSKQMKQMLPLKYASKTVVITDPIDMDKFTENDKQYSRERFFPDFKKSDILILFTSISRKNPIKRFEMAESVVRRLNELDTTLTYRLVSANNFSNDDMKYVFSAVDICLLTSVYEGWPNCIKESLACNTSFVSTNVSDLKDIAIKTNSCFVCDDNIEHLAEKIFVSLRQPKEELRKYIEFLSVDNIKIELMKVYQHTC
ncbi:MAG: glycosyltransferase [Bacteroidota bacterium]